MTIKADCMQFFRSKCVHYKYSISCYFVFNFRSKIVFLEPFLLDYIYLRNKMTNLLQLDRYLFGIEVIHLMIPSRTLFEIEQCMQTYYMFIMINILYQEVKCYESKIESIRLFQDSTNVTAISM